AAARRAAATCAGRGRGPSPREPVRQVEDDAGHVVGELLRDDEAERLAAPAQDEGGNAAGDRARRGQPLQVEVGQPAQQLFAVDVDGGERRRQLVHAQPGGAEALAGGGGRALDEEQATPGGDPDELLSRLHRHSLRVVPDLEHADRAGVPHGRARGGGRERPCERRGVLPLRSRAVGREEGELAHERSLSPRGSKNGASATLAVCVWPPTRMSMRSPCEARSGATQARPIVSPSRSLTRALVTRPAGRPSATTCAPSGGSAHAGMVKPTSRSRTPRSRSSSTARRPTKSSLSSLTIQGIPAESRVDSESVSWPTITCCFSSRSTRCASTPNGRAPPATSWSQTCSPAELAKCSS